MTDYALVASGAGALGLSEAIALETLIAGGIRFTATGGSSAGSINSAGIAFGLPMLSKLWENMLMSGRLCDWKVPLPGEDAVLHAPGILLGNGHYNGFGMIKGHVIRETLNAKLGDARMGDSIIPLRIVVSNLSLGQKEVVSSLNENHKRVRVVDAIMCSLAVPFVIDAQQLDPTSPVLYSDGGIGNNVPAALWDDHSEPTLVLRFMEDHTPVRVDDVFKMAKQVFKIMRQAAEDEISAKANTVQVVLPPVADALDFTPTAEACAKMKVAGSNTAKKWLKGGE